MSTTVPLSQSRISSLRKFVTSGKVRSAAHRVSSAGRTLRPAVAFAIHVALLTFMLGIYRFLDLEGVRAGFTEEGPSYPTLSAVFDAFESVLRAAEAVGSSVVAANSILWLGNVLAVSAVLLTAMSILIVRSEGPVLAWARYSRVTVREVYAWAIACAIVARIAGESSYLFAPSFWANLAVVGAVLWLTVWAEKRWLFRTEPARRIGGYAKDPYPQAVPAQPGAAGAAHEAGVTG